jgi:hypothetical protein
MITVLEPHLPLKIDQLYHQDSSRPRRGRLQQVQDNSGRQPPYILGPRPPIQEYQVQLQERKHIVEPLAHLPVLNLEVLTQLPALEHSRKAPTQKDQASVLVRSAHTPARRQLVQIPIVVCSPLPAHMKSNNTFADTLTRSSDLTPTRSSLRRPQTSPRSPLTSVRNIVAAWKERTPSLGKKSPQREGLFSLRRRADRSSRNMEQDAIKNLGQKHGSLIGHDRVATPRSESSNLSTSGLIPPPFDAAEFANMSGSQEVCRSTTESSLSLMDLIASANRVAMVSKRPRTSALQMAKMSSSLIPTYASSFLDCSWRGQRHSHLRFIKLHRSTVCSFSHASYSQR